MVQGKCQDRSPCLRSRPSPRYHSHRRSTITAGHPARHHEGYPWSDGEEKGAKVALAGSGVELEVHRMDTRRNPGDVLAKAASEKTTAEIEVFKPDLVIVTGDFALKFLLEPFCKDAKLPLVFAGVNWDAGKHGLPYQTATGMLEVAPVKALIASLRACARGDRVGYMTVESEAERVEGPSYEEVIGKPFTVARYAETMAEWKDGFKEMQGEVAIILVGDTAASHDWNEAAARAWALEQGKLPSGCACDFKMPCAMLGFTRVEEEQGAWAGTAALRILKVSRRPPSPSSPTRSRRSSST